MSEGGRLQREVDELRRMRDALRVQLHLGGMEAKEIWEDLEERWERLDARVDQVAYESKEILGDVDKAARALVREIRDGYHHIKRLI